MSTRRAEYWTTVNRRTKFITKYCAKVKPLLVRVTQQTQRAGSAIQSSVLNLNSNETTISPFVWADHHCGWIAITKIRPQCSCPCRMVILYRGKQGTPSTTPFQDIVRCYTHITVIKCNRSIKEECALVLGLNNNELPIIFCGAFVDPSHYFLPHTPTSSQEEGGNVCAHTVVASVLSLATGFIGGCT